MPDRPYTPTSLLPIISAAAAVFMAATTHAQPCHRYEVVDFRPLPDDLCQFGTGHDVNGSNGLGDFAGAYGCLGTYRPYLSTPEAFIELGGPSHSRARDVNADRVVVGTANGHLGYSSVGWYWRDGTMTFVEPEPPLSGTSLLRITDDNLAIGKVLHPDADSWIPALYEIETGTWTVFSLDIPGIRSGSVLTIHASGALAGQFTPEDTNAYRPFIRHPDGRIDIPQTCREAVDGDTGAIGAIAPKLGLLAGSCKTMWIGPSLPLVWFDGVPEVQAMPPEAVSATIAHIHSESVWFGGSDHPDYGAWRPTVWFHGRPFYMNPLIDHAPESEVGFNFDRQAWIGPDGSIQVHAGIDGVGGIVQLAPVAAPPGDLNCDAIVDFDDLLAVLANWGPCATSTCPYDIDDDDIVDNAEALNVLLHWTP